MTMAFASELLSISGVRLIELNGTMRVGVWSWLDNKMLREAVQVFSPDAPIVYLDGNGIPDRYKTYLGAPHLDDEPPYHHQCRKE